MVQSDSRDDECLATIRLKQENELREELEEVTFFLGIYNISVPEGNHHW